MASELEAHKSSKPSFFKVLMGDFSEQLVTYHASFLRLIESLDSLFV